MEKEPSPLQEPQTPLRPAPSLLELLKRTSRGVGGLLRAIVVSLISRLLIRLILRLPGLHVLSELFGLDP
jgi:hypothetical protein